MTAYSRQHSPIGNGEIVWELRTLNSRYLEVFIKMPEEWRSLEPSIRELIGKKLRRGKVECMMRFRRGVNEVSGIDLNEQLASKVVELSKQIQSQGDKLGLEFTAVSPVEILRWPGVVTEQEQDLTNVFGKAMEVLEQAVDGLVESREREGQRLAQFILERCDQVSEHVRHVRTIVPDLREKLREKLLSRLAEIDVQADPQRFEQELVFQLQRLDVDEELDRLDSHVEEVKNVLKRKDAIGRRLDFIMQELNREANTLGSKSSNIATTNSSVDLKVLIEQMREQVQNIE
jgi:uncharacterized protein (TIGR00255 family)